MSPFSRIAPAALAAALIAVPAAGATPGAITAFPTGIGAAVEVDAIATGPNGKLWLTQAGVSQLTRVDPSTGATTAIPTPTACTSARAVALMPDGHLWFPCTYDRIGLVSGTGVVSTIPNGGGFTTGLAAGEGEWNWTITDASFVAVGSGGHAPIESAFARLTGVADDGNGVPWVASPDTHALYRMALDPVHGSLMPQRFDVTVPGALPFHMATGPGGSVWTTEGGRMLADAPLLRTWPDGATEVVPGTDGQTFDVARGPGNTMWYTDYAAGTVGRVLADGTPAQFRLPDNPGDGRQPHPTGVAMGADGNMWVVAHGAGGRMFRVLTGQVPVQNVAPVVEGTTAAGATLTSTTGDWAYRPTAYAFQWERCTRAGGGGCSPIAGATGRTHVVSPADEGRWLRVGVTATNLNGDGLPDHSVAVAIDGGATGPGSGAGGGGPQAAGGGAGAVADGASVGPIAVDRSAVLWIRGTQRAVTARVRMASPGVIVLGAHIGRSRACTRGVTVRRASTVTVTCQLSRAARARIARAARSKVMVSLGITPRNWPSQSVSRVLTVRRGR